MTSRPASAALAILAATACAGVAHAEDWLAQTDMFGTPLYQALTLHGAGDVLDGQLDRDPLTGRRHGGQVTFTVRDSEGAVSAYAGAVAGEAITGTADVPDSNTPGARVAHRFTARLLPPKPAAPRRLAFAPTSWSNEFSAYRAPVLILWSGDTVHTTTIDSGGVDERGASRALYGNPQTGPFFVADARPGDTLAVHIEHLALNRDYADSLDAIVERALRPSLAAKTEGLGKPVRWRLDRQQGTASPEAASGALSRFSVPLKPMLGCVAVAPGFGYAPFSTGDSGRFGGNMDYNGVTEGSTVYLQVQQPGALLYIGDAHAAQGDGETTQYALETSMDVTFRVEVLHGPAISTPRVRSADGIAALGFAGSADEALRAATAGLVQWLEQDYGLTPSQSAQVMGAALHYTVAEIADRNVGVAARLDQQTLDGLTPKH